MAHAAMQQLDDDVHKNFLKNIANCLCAVNGKVKTSHVAMI
jgi:hypothetical protein